MRRAAILTHTQVKSLIDTNRRLYVSYLFIDKFIDREDYKTLVMLKNALLKRKMLFDQVDNDGNKFCVEYHNQNQFLLVYTITVDKVIIYHDKIDLSIIDLPLLVELAATMTISEYEKVLELFIAKIISTSSTPESNILDENFPF